MKQPFSKAEPFFDVYSFCLTIMIIEIGVDQAYELILEAQNQYVHF